MIKSRAILIVPVSLIAVYILNQLKNQAQPPTPYDQYAIGGEYSAVSPALSPDGNQVVYSSPITGHGDIYIADTRTKKTKRLTFDSDWEADPQFSPDQRSIVYIRNFNIWIMHVDGSHPKALTFGATIKRRPRFSPDSKSIIFEETDRSKKTNIKLLLFNHPGIIKVTKVADYYGYPIIDDEQNIYYVKFSSQHVGYIIKSDITSHTMSTLGRGSYIALSPDKKYLLSIDDPYSETIKLISTNGAQAQIVLNTQTYKSNPSFYPDGKHLLFYESSERTGRCLSRISIADHRDHQVLKLPW
jgi:Tol biopolymer transport system component